jgi:hypothetical protein
MPASAPTNLRDERALDTTDATSPGARASGSPPASGTSDPQRTRRGWALTPSLPAAAAAVLVILLPLAFGHRWLALDGDPGRHIRVGDTILRSGLFYHDPFSFTRAGAPFVPYEWLSEVLAALSVRAAGLPGLIVLTGTVLALTYAVVAHTLRRRAVAPALAVLVLVLVMIIGVVHWHARPHAFTFLCAALLIELIDRAASPRWPVTTRGIWSAAWPVIPLFAFWANLHGGFLYGLFILAAVVVGDRLEMLAAGGSDRDVWRGALTRHAAMLACAVVAVNFTPSGPRLYTHTVAYLRDTYLVNLTQEYRSPDFHGLSFTLIAIVAVVAVLAVLPRRPRFPTLGLVVLNLTFSLMAARNLPLFGIVVLPLIAVELDRALSQWVPWWTRRLHPPAVSRSRVATYGWPLVALAGISALARVSDRAATARGGSPPAHYELLATSFNDEIFPVRAVREARSAHVSGRLFHEFTWGGYILYAWPEQRVFIDGQTDFYGDSVTKEFVAIHDLEPGWRAKLAAWRIDLALLAPSGSLADALAHEPGWRPVHCDATAVLFIRDSTTGPALAPLASLPAKCASLPNPTPTSPPLAGSRPGAV